MCSPDTFVNFTFTVFSQMPLRCTGDAFRRDIIETVHNFYSKACEDDSVG